MSDRERGHIRWFSHQKKYGLINRGNGEPNAFVHSSGFRHAADAQRVEDGDAVEFTVDQEAKGPQARDVVAVEASTTVLSGSDVG